MPSTPKPSTPLRLSTAATANTPSQAEPWSRGASDRFGGYGSLYKKEPVSTTPRKTPVKRSSQESTPGVDRFATPNERLAIESTTPKPSAVFASTTDRFALPGAHVAPTAAPGVGTYNVTDQGVRGVIKLQAAVRRRQSRGIFVQLASAAFAKPITHAGERFAGCSSIYGTSTPGLATPGVGTYEPTIPSVGESTTTGLGPSAAFKGCDDRFERHDSIYVPSACEDLVTSIAGINGATDGLPKRSEASAAFASPAFGGATDRFAGPGTIYHGTVDADTPGVGAYDVTPPEIDQKIVDASCATMNASFVSSTDRFALPGSHLAMSDAPGVGTYRPRKSAVGAPLLQHEDAAFTSTTDRFALPGAHVAPTAAPGVGTYHVNDDLQAARVLGAVKLQAAVRRRQSRGIFKPLEEHAKVVPGPGAYAPEVLPSQAQAAMAPIASRAVEEDETPPPPPPPPPELSVEEEAVPFNFSTDAEELAASPVVVRQPPRGVSLSKVVSLDMWLAEDEDEDEDEEEGSGAPIRQLDSAPMLARSGSTTPWGALAPVREEEDEMHSSRLSARLSMQSVLSDAADGDWLFSQLQRMMTETEVSREDYYSPEDGWDLDGLREDLQLYMAQASVIVS